MFVHDPAVRRDVTTAFLDRGWPQNEPLLHEMFSLRHELANLVGYADWASYDADVKMIGKGPAIPEFIDRIAEAADEPMRRDLGLLLERYRRDVPDASAIDTADSLYYEELVRREQHDVDAQQVRTYFDFTRVRQGLLDVTARLFGVRYEPVPEARVWHEDVTVYDVLSAEPYGERIGRIYLDLHPREGKYKHAAQFTLADGLADRQLAEGVLVCNFSRGLMEHDHVVTLFHEFGHLVHHVLAGRGEWTRFAGVATEWDFVEAPSQMLEEWAWDADVLRTFAIDADGEPIPADLVERMRAADDFGKGYHARTQMFYAAMSYWFHTDRPADLTAAMRELQSRYSPFPYIDGTHMFASFGHLSGYTSAYYTYMWSLVIAKDLFSAFDPDEPLRHRGRRPVPRPGPRSRWLEGRRRPGRRLPRPAVHVRRVRRLAGSLTADAGNRTCRRARDVDVRSRYIVNCRRQSFVRIAILIQTVSGEGSRHGTARIRSAVGRPWRRTVATARRPARRAVGWLGTGRVRSAGQPGTAAVGGRSVRSRPG